MKPRFTKSLLTLYYNSLQPVFTNATGIHLPNGKFTGEIGDIAYNKSDIGLSPVRYLAMRAKYLSYLPDLQVFRLVKMLRIKYCKNESLKYVKIIITFFFYFRIIFGFMNPKTVGTYKALLLPLSEGVWATLAGITVATVLCYHFIQRYSMNRQDDYEISAGVVYAIGLVAQQGKFIIFIRSYCFD